MSYSSLCGLSPVKLEGVVLQDGILNILFYRYISEKLCKNINDNEKKAGNNNFDYSQSTDVKFVKISLKRQEFPISI